jgi:hypothetical protein
MCGTLGPGDQPVVRAAAKILCHEINLYYNSDILREC